MDMKSRCHVPQKKVGNSRWLMTVIILFALNVPSPLLAEGQHDFLFFLSAEVFENTSVDVSGIESSDFIPTADFLYSYSGNRMRVLGEYIWSSTENELERLQVGWQTGQDTMLWLGRFHTPGNYWNTEFHHGQYLQTSISRPGIDEWEDEGGPLVSHITGALFESDLTLRESAGLRVAFGAGLGPVLSGGELRPFDLLDTSSVHDRAIGFRLAYLPDIIGENQVGILGGLATIPVSPGSTPMVPTLDEIEQYHVGPYLDWRWGALRLISAVFYVENDLKLPGATVNDRFTSGYLQAEYQTSENWTLFGRHEDSDDAADSVYLSLFPEFIERRNMLGVRWDFAKRHAFSFEVSETEIQSDNFTQFRLQWSAVLP